MSEFNAPETLQSLLEERLSSEARLSFLDESGKVKSSLTPKELYDKAYRYSQCLVSAELSRGKDIIITSFHEHEDHILIFWAACLAGIPVCPIPPLHPDAKRQELFLRHLQNLFEGPTIIGDLENIKVIESLCPDIKTLTLEELNGGTIDSESRLKIYPILKPLPNDIVALMLTSGSTGNCKAVPLRHSNIISAVNGKAEKHGSGPHSKFLNWIAFDHVASLTEIHIQALFCKASQFHVHSTAILAKPLNLLSWASKYHITYTFSPNFLMAKICKEVSLIPWDDSLNLSALEAYISGGEAIPVKTGVEFSNLLRKCGAKANVLRPGFGMTETCAGSIYDTRKVLDGASLYEEKYLSLGKSCLGIEFRVVHPYNRTVLEPGQDLEGELQVKGPTVFDGYYNNPLATKESFDGPWFITGDTAKIDSGGNLFLTGRDKDNININGVKHPSVDIENFIQDSHIQHVVSYNVFVCPLRLSPHADTETYAVFYQHEDAIDLDEVSTEKLAVTVSTSQAIAQVCTIFTSHAPHVVLPLPKKYFTKTALGKISRSFLTKAYIEGVFKNIEEALKLLREDVFPVDSRPHSSFEKRVFQVVGETLGCSSSSLRSSHNIFDHGLSSIHLMQLKRRFEDTFSLPTIPVIEILKRPQLEELCGYLQKLRNGQDAGLDKEEAVDEYEPLVCLNATGSKPPLFLVHPGVGEILVFLGLSKELNDDRAIYAIRARGFEGNQPPFSSFEDMVLVYTRAIENKFPQGPYYIGGYSFGGAVAFEIGKKLISRNKRVAWIGILNLPPHIQTRMNELVWTEVLLNLCMFTGLIDVDAFDRTKHQLLGEFPTLGTLDAEPENSEEIIDWILAHSNQTRLKELGLSVHEIKRWAYIAFTITEQGRTYEPTGLVENVLLTIFCAVPLPSMGTREAYKANQLLKWKGYARTVEFVDVEGEHYTMLSEEHVSSFAAKLRAALALASERLEEKVTNGF